MTVTSTVPVPAGVVAEQLVAVQETPLAGTVRSGMEVASVRLVPVMVTGVPPSSGPLAGVTLVTVGTVGGGG